jgi:Uma2 family endonuclease
MDSTYEARLTYDDFVHFPDDGRRHELIAGEHIVSPSPNTRHQELVGRLHLEIGVYLRQHPEVGRVFVAPFDVVLSFWDVVEPDLLIIAGDQLEILTEQNVRGAPAIVIEVLSAGTRKIDEQSKRKLFDREGVREYWLVDPEMNVVTVLRRQPGGSFAVVSRLLREEDQILTTPILPGLAISLRDLLD